MSNKDNMVVDFSSRRVLRGTKSQDNVKDNMEQLIDQAKQDGLRELEEFEEAVYDFLERIEGLVIAKRYQLLIQSLLLDEIAKKSLASLLKGPVPPGADKESYHEARRELFRELIAKHERDKESHE